ncbi:MAG: MBL fold metallo-hydrolase [Candidatus Latescibacterota bacterium]
MSTPPGGSPSRLGGNTPCVEVLESGCETLILDAGMGLHWLGCDLMGRGFACGAGVAHVLLTHLHWGHIQGIPFFPPLLVPGNRITFCGGSAPGRPLSELLSLQMDDVYCPVPNALGDDVGAAVSVREIGPGSFTIGAWRVTAARVQHSGPCLGFRVECGSASLAYLPDVEYLERRHWRPALELAEGADLLIHDAHCTAAEYPASRGHGHCCDRDAVRLARQAGSRHLLLFHHRPERVDPDEYGPALAAAPDLSVEPAREGAVYALAGGEAEPVPAPAGAQGAEGST